MILYDTKVVSEKVSYIGCLSCGGLVTDLNNYHDKSEKLKIYKTKAAEVREGWRTFLVDEYKQKNLSHLIGGQLPYYYRSPEKIGNEFKARHNALEMLIDLAVKMPTSEKFQRSHCGEILCSIYLEDILGLKRLYSKLTLTTAENTNVHKMDAFFVDTTDKKFEYYAVEAKCSVLPTATSQFSGHRHGILKQMIASLDGYSDIDERFDFAAIRDNLEDGVYSDKEKAQIRKDLIPPGPERLTTLGIAAINLCTVSERDDDYILTEVCSRNFSFYSLAVANLDKLAKESFLHWVKKA